ncbi:DsbA family protein [Acetobacteraceae bacterium KSS8]|uniref:DsbA family protein n=1 Tax=Endosaccharibacter trunci TaxID=2812733 RepID=A0ABT1W5R4_9PROT|nr:DsbA family protein [Acetobacteraceae bacterium KSS8]
MVLDRRTLLAAAAMAGLPIAGLRSARATVPAGVTAATLPEHSLGDPNAKVVVQEWFSLTCTHCAHFSQIVFPEIKAKLIDTGKIRYTFHDYPLDQVALAAAMIADSLPEDRYLPFIEALFASQDRWAFDRSADPMAMLRQNALLAGMPGGAADAALHDDALRRAIIERQDQATRQYNITGTPCFVFNQTVQANVPDYASFARYAAEAGAA